MRISLPTALMASALLLNHTSARPQKRTVTVSTSKTEIIYTTATVNASDSDYATSVGGIQTESSNSEVATLSTVTVIPTPVRTVSGVPGISPGTGSPSSVRFQAAGEVGGARPTGHSGTTQPTLSPLNVVITIPNLKIDSSTSISTTLTTPSTIPVPTTSPSKPSSTLAPSIVIDHFSSPTISATTTSTSSAASATSSPSTSTNLTIPFLRGVNLGGWLVLEKWMNSDVFTDAFSTAIDQYTFDQLPNANATLQTHWQTYINETDVKALSDAGINALRIPIGYWAFNNTNTPYIQGAEQYLDQAIDWARTYGMKIWIDCHGSPGSQNGFDNSGQKGSVNWQQAANLQQSITVLQTMAAKYGASSYKDVVVGLELVNEPLSYGNNVFSVTQSWAQEAFTAVKSVVQNQDMVVVMHDAFQGPMAWTSVATTLLSTLTGETQKTFGVDTHLYQLYTDAYNALTQAQHITAACGWATNLAVANAVMPTYVGEWSAATNICVNPDGSTTAGTTCSVSGCQCQASNFVNWNDAMIEQVRRFVEAQLDAFESSSSGWFMWSAKGPGAWGFLNGVKKGFIPSPITSRKYPRQCESL